MTWPAWLLTLWLATQLPLAAAWHVFLRNRKHPEPS